jgi:hypothetical protein
LRRTYFGGVERGERNLTLKSVERTAEMLDVDPLELDGTRTAARSCTANSD